MAIPLAASDVLKREFLAVRAELIDLAAVLDRIDRAEGTVADDPHLEKIRLALQILAGDRVDRAEQIQLIFSLPYRDDWQSDYGL